MKYKIGLSWPLLCRHVLDKCSTVCEVASGLTPQEAGITEPRFNFLKTKFGISTCLGFKQTISLKCLALVFYCFFVCWHLNQEPWIVDQDLGFRNRAIKHSLKTRQLIIGYIKLLDFADFAVHAANSRIGPFASRVLNLNHLIHKKKGKLAMGKV